MNNSDDVPCLTPEGKKWLTTALDPFHDTNVDLMGLPDANGSPSFVVSVQETQTISPPSGSTTWSAHISFSRLVFPQQMSYLNVGSGVPSRAYGTQAQIYTTSGNGYACNVGPITYALSANNSNENWVNATSSNTMGNFGSTTRSPARIIGMAFEVADVTPKLYQQGSVTVYTAPASVVRCFPFQVNDNTNSSNVVADLYSGGAFNQQVAQQLRGSRTWAAAEGAYCVARVADFDMEPSQLGSGSLCMSFQNSSGQSQPFGTAYNPVAMIQSNWAGGANGFSPGGAIFTGLNGANGSLQITTRIIYEYFPYPNTGDPYLPLSSPSAPYDACAFQAYSRAIALLPPGVPVRMNPGGEWFKMALNAVDRSGLISLISPMAGRLTSALNNYLNVPTSRTKLGRNRSASLDRPHPYPNFPRNTKKQVRPLPKKIKRANRRKTRNTLRT